jgi:hypothetical protein
VSGTDGQINGFDHEEGYDYELRVSDRNNPPSNLALRHYTLVEAVSKTLIQKSSVKARI